MTVKPNFKTNQPVSVTTRIGAPVKHGRFAGLDDRGAGKGGGIYVRVNFAEKGKPAAIKAYRPGCVAAA